MNERLTPEQIAKILAAHLCWRRGEAGGKRADLRGADLQRAYLQGADLRGAYLQGVYLQGADLQGAYLQGVYLRGAYLQGADLREADLRGVYLQGADLRGADLRGADLRGADLRGANFQRANLPFRIMVLGPGGSRNDYLQYRFDTGDTATGCFTGTLDDFAAAVEKQHGKNKHGHYYQRVIAFIRAEIMAEEAGDE